ncbi:MAG: CHAD domain-containing protein [Chitinophagaceae bacterium]
MEKKKLKVLISARLKKMKKYCDSIQHSFGDEDIHKFRVEVKKLRAFLRLIGLGLKNPGNLKLPKKLKDINAAAGVIRDIHLHLQRMEAAVPENADKPDSYLNLLKEKVAKTQKKLGKLLSKDPMPSMEKEILKALPAHLPVETINKFVKQKMTAIALLILGRHEEDEDIHTVRKHLKDLMYDVRIFQEDEKNALLKPLLAAEKINQIDQLAQRLGEFNDICFAILFLEPGYLKQVDENEKKQLLRIQEGWLQEKKTLKQAALNNLSSFYPAFISSAN